MPDPILAEAIDPPDSLAPANQPAPAVAGWRQFVDQPWLLLAMLFFVTAAIGLPLLWISRAFSPFWKAVITVLNLVWTALILWVFYLIMAWCIGRIMDAI